MKKLIVILLILLPWVAAGSWHPITSGGGTTPSVGGSITGGTDTRVLFDDANTFGEDAELTYNKTTNTLTTTTFVGALTGTASLATALASDPTDCSAGRVATGIAANGNLSCTASPVLTTVTATQFISGTNKQPVMSNDRRFRRAVQEKNSSTTFTGVGMAAPSPYGASAIPTAVTNVGTRSYINCQTKSASPTSGDVCGWEMNGGAFNYTLPDWSPCLTAYIRTPTTTSTMRIQVGLVSATINTVSSSTTNTAQQFASVIYDTGGAADATHWQFCSSKGTGAGNMSCTDTNIAVQAATEYVITTCIDSTSAMTAYINGTAIPKATNVPTTGTALAPEFTVVTLTGGQRDFYLQRFELVDN